MVELLVIADDFTGALDTGVQFKTKGTLIRVGSGAWDFETLGREVKVLIIDAETRHMTAQQAFQTVHSIVRAAVKAGVPCIYKKTDSGLRGNIGSELSAMLQASGRERLHFIPAFPLMGRTTVEGVHYIGGTPVAQSVFGADPFEPVRFSGIRDIIASQSRVETHLMGKGAAGDLPRGVLIYDSDTDRDLADIAGELKRRGELHMLSGCAGFAAALPQLLGLEQSGQTAALKDDLLVVCGSINPITLKQMDEAERQGVPRIRMKLEQKLETAWLDTPRGVETLERWKRLVESAPCAILESASSLEEETVQQYAQRAGFPQEEIRFRIANTMGAILERLLARGLRRTMLVTGGDTLMSFMEKIHLNELSPICELFPGIVLSQIQYLGQTYSLVSKSGGFGESSLFIDLEKMIHDSNKEELVC